MSVSPSVPATSTVVSRLRGAGCVFADDEARLLMAGAESLADLEAMVDQRVAGLPLEQVLGWVEFCGVRIAVEPGVFVPRRRTEFLVHQAAITVRETAATAAASAGRAADKGRDVSAVAARKVPAPRPTFVVDLCCGSGAVGAALAAAFDQVELYAVDIDPAAVHCARRNVAAAGGLVYEGDLYEPLPATLRHRVDVLVANAPYVPTAAIRLMPAEARLHESRVALDGGADGLDILRRVAASAPSWLRHDGHLLVETSEQQAPLTIDIFARTGLSSRVASSVDFDATIVIATMPLPRN